MAKGVFHMLHDASSVLFCTSQITSSTECHSNAAQVTMLASFASAQRIVHCVHSSLTYAGERYGGGGGGEPCNEWFVHKQRNCCMVGHECGSVANIQCCGAACWECSCASVKPSPLDQSLHGQLSPATYVFVSKPWQHCDQRIRGHQTALK